ncbi:MAG: hypothetical protein A2087_03475 [Spirochaetes bacterium GWD1_61_31]|nr:MAG: hypothetical protein A2Y37_11235 [Spirochaetes bacterium GWB1_60_80]OHD35350.1 MAG: hypothetical protein A2004_00470 [Spirochaetes bacterium GWC1_61_12]OHD36119.1 MAG: hypothetical protein A2087_03475 [Spirochaetes bacterium GWD1_61_31]OHD45006.1 MAG: hypothetical protein A2Y35_13280 [Spirochaetes bacterium GWE1_60_18]OHD60116.1 MAG: hypothetical protein A2Y32_11395 [Spirochaetes bacterium GWF1_60_12]HAP43685.1 hypothetical protein [Spirochaetaceae bacterium]
MAALTVRGYVTLVADELEALLHFAPPPTTAGNAEDTSEEINADRLNRLMSEQRLTPLPARKIDELLTNLAKAKGPVSIRVATGTLPEAGRPEEADWESLTAPGAFQPFASKVLAEADPPALFRSRVERIAHERIVKKPGLFAKAEKVVEYEKVERRESVKLDLQVVRYFWAPAGTALAAILPAKPGKAGKSIFGRPIPPPAMDESGFHLGSGLVKDKNLIRAEVDGFVRVGAQWADLIPFHDHRWEIKKSPDGANVLLDFKPGNRQLPMPDMAEILRLALECADSPDSLIEREEIERAISAAIRGGKALVGLPLSGDRDAVIAIAVSDDKLKASLRLVKGRGHGRALELSAVSAAIVAAKLRGVNGEKLKKDVLEFYHSDKVELADYPLAEGRSPTSGKDRSLSGSVAFLPDEQKMAYIKILKDEPALSRFCHSLNDFALNEVVSLCFVKIDQEIAHFSPPSIGTPGMTVLGAILPALPGNDPVVWPFENVRLGNESLDSMEDGLLLVGEKDGESLLRVLPYRDALIEVIIDEAARQASLNLACEYGLGRPLNLERVQATLKAEGVSYGIDLKAITTAITDAKDGQEVKNRIVAQAREPVPAGGFRLHWQVRLATGAALTVRDDGSTDFKNQDRATIVTLGQPILRLEQIGTTGQDGMDVAGRIIRAPRDPRAGEAPSWDDSLSVEKLESGEQLIIATRSGNLRYEKNQLTIDAMQKIKGDVDAATGNLKFPGPVAISGSIVNGFAIIAGGDVFIGGSVEAALVSSDGAVRITEGVKGAKKGTVRARKTIDASFAEQAILLSVDNISLKSSALLCNIKTNGKVLLQGERGHLVGGLCRARNGVEAQNLGSDKGIKTQVSFGQDYLMHDLIETEEREIDKLRALLLQTDRKLNDLQKIGGNPDQTHQEKVKLLKLLEKRGIRLIELREKFDEYHPGDIVVRGTIYPGVILESHNRFHEIRTAKSRVCFSFDPQLGRILELPLK